jgi:hypothetical protein
MSMAHNKRRANRLFSFYPGAATFFLPAIAAPWESATTKFIAIYGRLVQSLSVIAVMALCLFNVLGLAADYHTVTNSFGLFIILAMASIARMS